MASTDPEPKSLGPSAAKRREGHVSPSSSSSSSSSTSGGEAASDQSSSSSASTSSSTPSGSSSSNTPSPTPSPPPSAASELMDNSDNTPSIPTKPLPPTSPSSLLPGGDAAGQMPITLTFDPSLKQLQRLFQETVEGGKSSCTVHDILFLLSNGKEGEDGAASQFMSHILSHLQMRLTLVKTSERKSQVVVVLGSDRTRAITELLEVLFTHAAVKKKQAKDAAAEKMDNYLGKMGIFGAQRKVNVLANRKKKKKGTDSAVTAPASQEAGGKKLLEDLTAMRRLMRFFARSSSHTGLCFSLVQVFVDPSGVILCAALSHVLRTLSNFDALEAFDDANREEISNLMARAGCTEEQVQTFWTFLEATRILMRLKFSSNSSTSGTEVAQSSMADLARFAEIAEVDPAELKRCLCRRHVRAGNRASFIWVSLSAEQARRGARGFAMAILTSLMEFVQSKANHCLSLHSPGASKAHSIAFLEGSSSGNESLSDLERLLVNYAEEEIYNRMAAALCAKENELLGTHGMASLHIATPSNETCVAFRAKHIGLVDVVNEHTSMLHLGSRATRALERRLKDVAQAFPSVISTRQDGQQVIFVVRHWCGDIQYDSSKMLDHNAQSLRVELAQLLVEKAQNVLLRDIFHVSSAYQRAVVTSEEAEEGRPMKRRQDATLFAKQFVAEADRMLEKIDKADLHFVCSFRGDDDHGAALRTLGFTRIADTSNNKGFTHLVPLTQLAQGSIRSIDEVAHMLQISPEELVIGATLCAMTDGAYNTWISWHNDRFNRAALSIQSAFRRVLLHRRIHKKRQLLSRRTSAATLLQASVRMATHQGSYLRARKAVVKLQAWHRQKAAQKDFRIRRSASRRVRKAWMRYRLCSTVWRRACDRRAVTMQKYVRRWLVRMRRVREKKSVVLIQAMRRREVVLRRMQKMKEVAEQYREVLDNGELVCWGGGVTIGDVEGDGGGNARMVLTSKHRIVVLSASSSILFQSKDVEAMAWAVLRGKEVILRNIETQKAIRLRPEVPSEVINLVKALSEDHRPSDCLGLGIAHASREKEHWMVSGQCAGRLTLRKPKKKALKKRMSSMRLRRGKQKQVEQPDIPVECLVQWQRNTLLFRNIRPRRVLLAFSLTNDLHVLFPSKDPKIRFERIIQGEIPDEVILECDPPCVAKLFDWIKARIEFRRKEKETGTSQMELWLLRGDDAMKSNRMDEALRLFSKTLDAVDKALSYHTMESDSQVFYKMMHTTKRYSIHALTKRADCKLRLNAAKGALSDALSALALDSTNVEALEMKSRAALKLADYATAMSAARAAIQCEFRHLPSQKLLHEVMIAATKGEDKTGDTSLCKLLGIGEVMKGRADVAFWSATECWLQFDEGEEVNVLLRFDSGMAYGYCCGCYGFFPLNYVDLSVA